MSEHKQQELKLEESQPKAPQTRGVYLLPNVLTTAGLFAGFYAIVAAMKGHFDSAAIAIFIGIVADGLDGRVARLTNTQSSFGAQYDSLADMVAFGLAPALVVYSWSLFHLGKLGWLAAFMYTAATALRLARFNTQAHDSDKRYFQGFPCPSAAGVIASTVWIGSDYEISGMIAAIPIALLTIFVGALMVSTIRYYSFKVMEFKGRVPFFSAVLMVVVITAIALDPPEVLFGVFFLYAFSGPIMTLWQIRKVKKQRMIEK